MSLSKLYKIIFVLSLTQILISTKALANDQVQTISLSQALNLLEKQNYSLKQAKSRSDEALAIVRQATAPLLPKLIATGNYTRNSDKAEITLGTLFSQLPLPASAQNNLPPNIVMQPQESFSATGSLHVPIFVPTAWADRRAANETAAAASATIDSTRLQLRTVLKNAALLSNAAETIVTAAEQAVIVAQEQVQLAMRAVQAGTAAQLSILQAQTYATRRESDKVRALAELERSRLAIAIILGQSEPIKIELEENSDTLQQAKQQLIDYALSHRPELLAQNSLTKAAQAQLSSAWWRLAPELSATGSVFASDIEYPSGKKNGWRTTIDLNWTLYDGGFRYGKKDQAQAQIVSARASADALRLSIIQEVEDTTRELQVAQEQLRLALKQRELAAQAAATAKRGFAAGTTGSVDVLDANDKLFQAEMSLANAKAQAGIAKIAIDRAVGR